VGVPSDFKGGLGKWTTNQRQKKKRGDLRHDREEKLTAIGFEWEFRSVIPWKDRFAALKEFKKKHGHCNVPQSEYGGLGNWVSHQRLQKSKKTMPSQREKWLTDLGLQWKLYNGSYWEETFNELARFEKENGHCNVTLRHSLPLGRWVKDQRKKKRLGTLPKYQEEKLLALGMRFGTSKITWDEHFNHLREYKKAQGNCDVPLNHKNGLGNWICKQRYRAREGLLSEIQVQRLKGVGIDFEHKKRRSSNGSKPRKKSKLSKLSKLSAADTAAKKLSAEHEQNEAESTSCITSSSSDSDETDPAADCATSPTGVATAATAATAAAINKGRFASPTIAAAAGVLPNRSMSNYDNCTADAFHYAKHLLMQQRRLAAASTQYELNHYSLPVQNPFVSPNAYAADSISSGIGAGLPTQLPPPTAPPPNLTALGHAANVLLKHQNLRKRGFVNSL